MICIPGDVESRNFGVIMQTVLLQFLRAWDVIVPSVIRYLKDVYVDAFFERGSLRLSSFRRFRQHMDEQRGDAGEGSITMEIINPESRHGVVAFNGQEAYVLCASTLQSAEVMRAFEGAQSGI